jgi:predicted NAD/FAD-binding protein
LRLFDYDSERLLKGDAPMFSFAKLKDIYATMTKKVPATFSMGRAVQAVKRFDKHVEVTDVDGVTETFSQIVMAANADKSLSMLEKPTRMERRCLGNVKCVCHVCCIIRSCVPCTRRNRTHTRTPYPATPPHCSSVRT